MADNETAIPGDNTGSATSSQTQAKHPTPASVTAFSGSDISSVHITAHKLDGKNYLQWAQSVKIVICGRGKLGYITGELPAPPLTDPTYKTWLAENSIEPQSMNR